MRTQFADLPTDVALPPAHLPDPTDDSEVSMSDDVLFRASNRSLGRQNTNKTTTKAPTTTTDDAKRAKNGTDDKKDDDAEGERGDCGRCHTCQCDTIISEKG